MIRWLYYRRQGLLHAALILLPLLLVYVHGQSQGRQTMLSQAASWVAAPGQILMDAAVSAVASGVRRYVLLAGVAERNASLVEENERLELRLTNLRRRLRTAERQATQCGFRYAREDLQLAPARVVAEELGPLNQVLRLAVELPEGAEEIPEDASVVAPNGLVGRVARHQGRLAEVEVLTDPRARIHARAGSRGVLGTVRGVGPGDRYGLRFRTTEGQARFDEGAAVVTSGHDRRYPPGLVIGTIGESAPRQQGVHLDYAVRPAVAFWELREVFVVLGRTVQAGGETP